MDKLSVDQIEEIAENISMGMLCFYHISTGDIISLPGETTEIHPDFNAIYSKEEIDRKSVV